MKILSINSVNYSSAASVKDSKKISPYYQSNSDVVSFSGYKESLCNAVKKNYIDVGMAEESFAELMKDLKNDNSITKNLFFDTVYNIYEQVGLKDLFNLLTSCNPISLVEKLIKVSEESVNIVLAKKGDRPIFFLHNLGRKGIFNTRTKPRDIRLGYADPKEKDIYLEYSTDKKNDLMLVQTFGKNYEETGFYSSTGRPKVITTEYGGGKPDVTYYNEDGSKSFFKNWFFGGTQNEPIY